MISHINDGHIFIFIYTAYLNSSILMLLISVFLVSYFLFTEQYRYLISEKVCDLVANQ